MAGFALAVISVILLIPVERHIDCTGWGGAGRAEVDVRIMAMDGTVVAFTMELLPGSSAAVARDCIWDQLETAGWRGYTLGKGIVVLQGAKKCSIRSVEFKSKEWTPTVRYALAPLPK